MEGIKNGNKRFKPPRPATGGASSASRQQPAGRDRPTERAVTPTSDNEDPTSTASERPSIPPQLLTRLLHDFFEDDSGQATGKGKMKVSREANALVGKYMETFVREALARAAFEREKEDEEAGGGGRGGRMRDRFLEVEDLEKLAPQLLLDF
ncbi:MAG: hypothetical protein M4579_004274 [Chaenotheca gracillima]|nr:MAG: hypothetical protein M4579_004274 [Chaenotheca gracillima]